MGQFGLLNTTEQQTFITGLISKHPLKIEHNYSSNFLSFQYLTDYEKDLVFVGGVAVSEKNGKSFFRSSALGLRPYSQSSKASA